MDSRGIMRPSRPQTVAELVAQAENFAFNTNIPMRNWIRAAETLYQEASFAMSEGDFGRAYMLLYRHSVLILNFLPKHPQFEEPENRKAYRALSKRIDLVIKEMEQIKPEIISAAKEWDRMRPAKPDLPPRDPAAPSSYSDFAARDPTLSGNAKILDASEHQELAVDLAQKELSRRDTIRRATRQAGIPEGETLARRQGGRWDSWDRPSHTTVDADLQRQMEAARRNLDSPSNGREASRDRHEPPPAAFTSQNYHYPSISKSRPVEYERSQSYKSTSTEQPSLPPKEPIRTEIDQPPRVGSLPPDVPKKINLSDYQPLIPTPPPKIAESQPDLPPKTVESAPAPPKKERLTFKPGAYLENGDPIRSIFLPRGLRKSFLEAAAENTRRGVEMCGILCGTPVNNALFIRCLLIPDQKCTPDTCETQNESAMFDYCDQEDLLMIGWIHTHPTQTCFMSSRDLHTHAGYQIMMPESIAIVCAPKFTPSYGIFRLTNPPGLEHILQCNHTDTFHQHSIGNLYREAEQPSGHVYETDKMPFYVHDLRSQ